MAISQIERPQIIIPSLQKAGIIELRQDVVKPIIPSLESLMEELDEIESQEKEEGSEIVIEKLKNKLE